MKFVFAAAAPIDNHSYKISPPRGNDTIAKCAVVAGPNGGRVTLSYLAGFAYKAFPKIGW